MSVLSRSSRDIRVRSRQVLRGHCKTVAASRILPNAASSVKEDDQRCPNIGAYKVNLLRRFRVNPKEDTLFHTHCSQASGATRGRTCTRRAAAPIPNRRANWACCGKYNSSVTNILLMIGLALYSSPYRVLISLHIGGRNGILTAL